MEANDNGSTTRSERTTTHDNCGEFRTVEWFAYAATGGERLEGRPTNALIDACLRATGGVAVATWEPSRGVWRHDPFAPDAESRVVTVRKAESTWRRVD